MKQPRRGGSMWSGCDSFFFIALKSTESSQATKQPRRRGSMCSGCDFFSSLMQRILLLGYMQKINKLIGNAAYGSRRFSCMLGIGNHFWTLRVQSPQNSYFRGNRTVTGCASFPKKKSKRFPLHSVAVGVHVPTEDPPP